jgi:hypothetical protein
MSVFWVVAPCTLINTDRRFRAAYCSIIVVTLPLVMEAVCTSETSVSFNETPRRYIPEYSQLHTRRRENVKSRCIQSVQLICSACSQSNFIIRKTVETRKYPSRIDWNSNRDWKGEQNLFCAHTDTRLQGQLVKIFPAYSVERVNSIPVHMSPPLRHILIQFESSSLFLISSNHLCMYFSSPTFVLQVLPILSSLIYKYNAHESVYITL